MSEEDKQKNKECMNGYRKNQFNNVLKKISENDEAKSVKVDVVTNFIKVLMMLKFILMIIVMTLKKIESLNLDKMHVAAKY